MTCQNPFIPYIGVRVVGGAGVAAGDVRRRRKYSVDIEDLWQIRQDVVAAGYANDIDVIAPALSHRDPMVRRLALGAAARANILTVQRLRTALTDPANEVVVRAVELAARIDDGHQVADVLIQMLEDDRFCEVAAFALGELPLVGDVLALADRALSDQATGHDDPLARESAVAALGALGVGLDAVLAGTGDIATIRRRAVLALAAFEDPRAEAALHAALTDRDWQVRQSAEDLITTDG